jgi:hypothetical protein
MRTRFYLAVLLLPVLDVQGACPDPSALALFKHQIAYQKTEESDPLGGLSVVHMQVWIRGALTGFYITERLPPPWASSLRMAYVFGPDELQGGGTCGVDQDWRRCMSAFPGVDASGPVTTCTVTVDLRSVPRWEPSPNDQRKRELAAALRGEIEAYLPGTREIVVRDFNLMDNQITMYLKMPDGDFYQGCSFHAKREPHCDGWHLFGQSPLSSIRRWIFQRPYRLK